jgi:hypothetical protein
MSAPFYELYQIHKPINFLRNQPQLLEVLPIYSLNHAVQTFNLLQLKNLCAAVESICFEPMSHLGEHHTGVLINHKLILTGFEHPESVFLVEVNT